MTLNRIDRLINFRLAAVREFDPAVLARRPSLPLVVGEAPSRNGAGEIEWHIFSTGRLAAYDISLFERTNLLKKWPGQQGSGSAFPLARAAPAAEALEKAQPHGRRFVLVGTRVATAFRIGRHKYDYLEWLDRGTREVAVVPHPSGLNRWWNSPENRNQAAAFFAAILRNEEA